jgi:hypothetical protein
MTGSGRRLSGASTIWTICGRVSNRRVRQAASASVYLRAMLISREKKPRLLTWRPRVEDDVEMEPFGAFSFRMAMVTKDECLDLHRACSRKQCSVCGQALDDRRGSLS